jgi:hypothetical protein
MNAVEFSGIGIGLAKTDLRRAVLDSLNIDSDIVYRIDEGLLSQFGIGKRPEYIALRRDTRAMNPPWRFV